MWSLLMREHKNIDIKKSEHKRHLLQYWDIFSLSMYDLPTKPINYILLKICTLPHLLLFSLQQA